MKVFSDAHALHPGARAVCAAIGVFDGVHLGHQHVLRETLSDAARNGAMPVAVTFDRHPNAVVAPGNVPPLIYPLEKKLEVIESLGIEAAYVIRFDTAFSRISGEQFIRDLAAGFKNIQSICVGDGFMFGAKRSGNVALLQSLGRELGFTLHALRDVKLDGQSVSSTRIRDTVRSGDFALAAKMLGRPYSLCGRVQRGDLLGRKLGFPTANLDVTSLLVPPGGVYAADALAGSARHRAAVNIGHRPTLETATPELRVEAHLLDFNGDLYGSQLELVFLEKVREEQKFASVESLREQIARDIAQVREVAGQ